jgi:hypothetical protein
MKLLPMPLRLAASVNKGFAFHRILGTRTSSVSQKMAFSNQVDIASWHSVYPPPRDVELKYVTREAVLQMMKDSESTTAKDFLLIDLRRTDHEVRFLSAACDITPPIWNRGVGY